MRQFNVLFRWGWTFLVVVTLALAGCDGDDGAAGRDGADGRDGIDGLPGADGTDATAVITIGNGSALTEEEIEELGKLQAVRSRALPWPARRSWISRSLTPMVIRQRALPPVTSGSRSPNSCRIRIPTSTAACRTGRATLIVPKTWQITQLAGAAMCWMWLSRQLPIADLTAVRMSKLRPASTSTHSARTWPISRHRSRFPGNRV